jgi:hypothetical protein
MRRCRDMRGNLEKEILAVQETGRGKGQLIERIVEGMVAERENYGFKDRTELLDLLAGFYHRIGNLVDKYRPSERGFGPYLASSLYFHRRARDIEARDRSFKETEVLQRSDADSGAEDADEGEERTFPRRGRAFLTEISADATRSASVESAGKRLLFLALKCSFDLSDAQVERLGEITGMGEEHLRTRIDALKSMARERIARRNLHMRVRDKVYAGLCYYEGRAKGECDPVKREEWETLADRFRTRLKRARERVNAVLADPTNEEIALVLGLPKGTIDSGLHYIRKSAASLPAASRAVYDPGHGNSRRQQERPQARGNALALPGPGPRFPRGCGDRSGSGGGRGQFPR